MKTIIRLAVLAVGLLLVSMPAAAQQTGRIQGKVTLEDNGEALHGARILIIELGRSTLSDGNGEFRFEGVPTGTYQLLATREHLQAQRLSVAVVPDDTSMADFALTLTAVHEEVTVTATGQETTAFDAFNSVQVLDSVDIAQNMAATIGELLEHEPGVAKRSFGPGSSRPIIRGFDNDRVLIMQDGVRTGDLSSQSGDHGVSIDPGGLERIEIVKGPATLLYGQNAIGGVVNTISPQRQFYEDPPDELRGQVNTDFGTTNSQAGGSANFQYGEREFMMWAGGGARRTGNYSSADGEVENSQTEQVNGRFGVGWFGARGYASVSYQVEDGTYGVPFAGELHGHGHEDEGEDSHEEDEHGEEELLIDLDQRRQVIRVEGGLRDLDAGPFDSVRGIFSYIDWNHDEIENFVETGESEVGTRFSNNQYIGRIEVQQDPSGRLNGQFGLWGQRREYVATGEEALAPPTEQDALAAFAYEELALPGVSLQFGGRVEYNRYRPDMRPELAGDDDEHDHDEDGEHHDEEPPAVRDRSFTGFSGSVGLRLPFLNNRAALVANGTSSYRAPSLEELYNYGPHVGNLAFEIGNPELSPERSTGGEISLRLNSDLLHGQVNFFYYDISDFIFGAPTGEVRDGLLELEFVQGDSRFVGADMNLSVHVSDQWRLHVGGGLVDAQLKGSDEPLPRIPPVNGRLAVDWLPTRSLQVRPELIVAAEQDQVYVDETPTDGYTLVNLSASYTLVGPKVMHIFSLKGTNLTNELYRNHTSFIKDVAPEMGRRVLLTYALRLF